ncbi:MAG TPA: NADH-quinone oxidoreductase subunit J [Candidatus Dormibacteraeota bacterium]|jgi:NADH:ubiquinone oxidoreductase subunit 6 (subunit J)
MDSLHAIGFYVSATLSMGGALFVAFLPGREARGLAMAAAGLGLSGVALALSAGFGAAVILVCYAGVAMLLAGPQYRSLQPVVHIAWRQIGALSAAGLFALLAYAAYRGDFVPANFYGGAFGSSSLGRLLFAHDALATEAVGALILVALVGAAAAWRAREHSR